MPTTSHRARVKFIFPPPRPLLPWGPERHSLIVGGRLAVAVALRGALGQGKVMVLDDVDWGRVKLALGERWGLKEANPGYCYVVSKGVQRGLVLARWLMGAKPGEVVSYINRDRLDVRRGNLATVERGEFVARAFGTQRAARNGVDEFAGRCSMGLCPNLPRSLLSSGD